MSQEPSSAKSSRSVTVERRSGAPKGTESFAVTMFDSDAAGGRGFWHWVMIDIPAATQTLAAGLSSAAALPNGATQAENDFGRPGYGGACPPVGSGTHHYTVTVFALSARMPLSTDTGAPAIAAWLKTHTLATAALTATYRR